MTNIVSDAVIRTYKYDNDIENEINKEKDSEVKKLILRYPTVYIIVDNSIKNKIKAYVGETNNIVRRTEEHINSESENREDWTEINKAKDSQIIVIAHEEFNKSLTLDIENRLMQYLLSDEMIYKLNNRRQNNQDLYFTYKKFPLIFNNIWKMLSEINGCIFPDVQKISNSSIFKASPFHKLTEEQLDAKNLVISKVKNNLQSLNNDNLILINGSAGTGKTVLLSSLFSDLNNLDSISSCYLVVNHKQQIDVYNNIAKKLGIKSEQGDDIVNTPTKFLNKHPINSKKVDIVLIDEAHLLLTQGSQAYTGKNQLSDIIDRAKVVVAVYDFQQILTSEEYVEKSIFSEMVEKSKRKGNLVTLKMQNRINANNNTINWIENFVSNNTIEPVPLDNNYDLKVFDDASKMYEEIKKHNNPKENSSNGLSRVVATFDWPYKKGKVPDDSQYWNVTADNNFSLPWNLQLKTPKQYKGLPWAEQPQTIEEVGSTYTIQGFDLNYCGLIIGNSVKYRNGKIIYDAKASFNTKAKRKRTFSNGEKVDISSTLLNNELNVLMKRGVHGLYIYAVDKQLREELLRQYNLKRQNK
ncbi:DUF2075 domain-containing protein [Apilactobacillus sp. M161]|uniref:DUF2075 domain-containing protein n=1 Tax=Apilactobacillus xinyiensis TaxID=2841032 RepID=A0ABT0HZD6_9LACO|nr:DUF2075 domain-containing protein [Apilactobacillus xinyiensis]MCK8623950.1 DUF2075 domain-containing protein [Apilactobacillus xinyiensis]